MLHPCYTSSYRGMIRNKYNISGSAAGDYCTQCCCFACAMCQETNEVYARGLKSLPGGQAEAAGDREAAGSVSEQNPASGETTPMLDKDS